MECMNRNIGTSVIGNEGILIDGCKVREYNFIENWIKSPDVFGKFVNFGLENWISGS